MFFHHISKADKRVDFIPSHKVSPLDSQKQSFVGKGNVISTKPKEKIIPTIHTNTLPVFQEEIKNTEKKRTIRANVKRERITRKKETVSDKNIARQTLNVNESDTSLQQSEMNDETDTSMNDAQMQDEEMKPILAVMKEENGVFVRSVFVLASLVIVGAFVLLGLQLNGYFTKKSALPVSTFTTNVDEEIIPAIQQPKRKENDIFATISERESHPIPERDDELAEEIESVNEAVNFDTVYLARQFGRGNGEVELAMKMMTHRKPSVVSSQYSNQASMIGNSDAQNKTGRRKDASVIAKKLGIGKGEVLLARHLEDLEHHQTKG
jgi:hypothetical protein